MPLAAGVVNEIMTDMLNQDKETVARAAPLGFRS